jgi:glycosyltransferase involved in cell wall biosynthesis
MTYNSGKIRVLVISPAPAQQFVLNDVRILSKSYDVSLVEGLKNGGLLKCLRSVPRSDFVLCWFGCRTAAFAVFLAKLFRKKVAVIAGGQDVADIPEIQHGLMRKRAHKGLIKFAFKNSDAAIAVSRFSAGELLRWAKPKVLCLIYNGVDIPKQVTPLRREGVLCVARVTPETIMLKGVEFLLKAANRLPQISFTIVGEVSDPAYRSLVPIIPANVRFSGRLDHESVLDLCQRAQVYVQPSYYESFGVALAEAMAHGCVPVVTDRGALPEVVGDTGFYVSYGDEIGLSDAISRAMRSEKGEYAMSRVAQFFTLERRGNLLRSLIDGLIQHSEIQQELLLSASGLQHTKMENRIGMVS